ncbi:MAG: zinc transporter ZntB [Gammaproteobacteria bacterium]|nr:zinc transporter ZntB [Gammaproteobacteria bacterium]
MTEEQAGLVDNGLIFGFQLDGNGGGVELEWEKIAVQTGGNQVEWLHFDFTNENVRKWLRDKSGINSLVVDALLHEDSRPRIFEQADGLLVTLRGVNTNPGADAEDMVSIRLWVQADRIISTRRRQLLSVVGIQQALCEGHGPRSSEALLFMLVKSLGERIEYVVEGLDESIEQLEVDIETGQQKGYETGFSNLRRQSARIRRYLAPQRDALERLSRLDTPLLSIKVREQIHEEANKITRYLEDLDLVRERAMVAQEELLARMANEQNSRMYVLSLVAAIFLPLSFLTGLMGMNVAGLPGTEDPKAFAMLVMLMLGAALGIVGLFKWQKWL